LANRVCELLGCEYPIVEGGLAYVGNGLLAAAISEAGGFGQVGSGGRSAEDFAKEVEIAASRTNHPFGANIPISEHHDQTPYLKVVEQYADKIRAVSLSAGNPRPMIEPLHQLGLIVMTLASTPQQALKAQTAGADLVICEGAEAGGHDGPAELTTMSLLPLCVSSVSIPVVAAGGITDGRTAAAAFCLGAEGVQMGTRFVATKECEAHVAYKEALVKATASDTQIIERSFGRVTRVMKSRFVDGILTQEIETPGDMEKLLPLISGRKNAVAAIAGQMNDGYVYCGMGVGNITEIQPAGDVVRSIGRDLFRILDETRNRIPIS
jgi:enoyl-[acyl-carrier protein] reductase II